MNRTLARNLAFFLLLIASTVLYLAFNGTGETTIETPRLRERYQAAERIPNEVRYRINRNWKGKGQVLVGRITEPDGVEISRRATIEKDGSFATAVYTGRTLEFYAHGYEPLVIEAKDLLGGSVYDAGESHFEPSPPDRLRTLEGTVFAESGTDKTQGIELMLVIPNDNPLSDDHGHWQHRNEPIAESATLKDGDSFSLSNLSPIPYELVLRADSYIEKRIKIAPSARGTIALGDLQIKRAKVLHFKYISQIDANDPAAWPPPEEAKVVCDGRKYFRFTDDRDKHRNIMKLRLYSKDDIIEAGFPWVPSEYYDLGEGTLQTLIDKGQKLELGKTISSRRLPLTDGHVYFFRNKKKDVSCLFEVTVQ